MLRKLFALVCLTSLTACGLKGPLYLPEKQPEPAPMSVPIPATENSQQSQVDSQAGVADKAP